MPFEDGKPKGAENSNNAILVSVTPQDIESDDVPGGMYFQRKLENTAFCLGGKNNYAPCRRLGDFMESKPSKKTARYCQVICRE